ncbi:MAG: glycosyltransferase family 1 protein, partial [Ramlibacter sp.]|nr:glycosyltransferase family 1 protein [Ramlibacter sp.]
MSGDRRVFFDTTFTRTQVGSVGITRTVRRLEDELRGVMPPGKSFHPVAFHSGGYRQVAAQQPAAAAAPAPAAHDSLAARLLRWVSESFVRRLAFALLPVALLQAAWRVQSALTFDRLSKDCVPVTFRSGDLLLLCDASWCCPAWTAARA